jgi:hypothetical protein
MKNFATYCIFIALIGGFGIKPFLLAPTQSLSPTMHVCSAKDAMDEEAITGCCKPQQAGAEDLHKKKGCHAEKEHKDCNNENDCTRTCCSSIMGFIHSNPTYDYSFSGIHKIYSSLYLTKLSNPYLAKLTPPPNS